MLWHFYDMDRTLLDSDQVHLKSLQKALKEVYQFEPSAKTVFSHFNQGGEYIFRNICRDESIDLTPDKLSRLIAEWQLAAREYSQNGLLKLMAGVPDCLQNDGVRRAIVTHTKREITNTLLEAANIRYHFDVFSYGENGDSKGEIMVHATSLTPLVGSIDRLAVIGDAPGDMAGGREVESYFLQQGMAIGVFCIGVTTGGYTKKELTQAGAQLVLNSLVKSEFEKIPPQYRS